jgi:hypothetical protein
MNAAKYRDQKTADENRQMMEGIGNVAKGATNAYLWQQRKNALKGLDALNDEESKLWSELEMLTGDQGEVGSTANFNAIMNGLDFNLMDTNMKQGMGGLY